MTDLEDSLQLRPALRGGDVLHERGAPRDRPDGVQVQTDDGAAHRHVLGSNLEPTYAPTHF